MWASTVSRCVASLAVIRGELGASGAAEVAGCRSSVPSGNGVRAFAIIDASASEVPPNARNCRRAGSKRVTRDTSTPSMAHGEAGTKKKPSPTFVGEGFPFFIDKRHQIKSLAVTYFHIDKVDTSIGAERFHFRVRKGIGWFPLAMAARQTGCKGAESWLSPFTNSTICFDAWSHSSLQLISHTRFDVRQIAWVLYGQASRAISTG